MKGLQGYSMNLDYIDVSKFLDKDKICLDYLQRNAIYDGAEMYYFSGCRKIEVWMRQATNQVNIKGSIPYFINGHNFYASHKDWMEGLDYIQGCLKVNIYSGQVNNFEFGTIQEIPFPEPDFLSHHIKVRGMEARAYHKGQVLTGREFVSPSLKIKLYDVQRNIKTKLDKPIRADLSRDYGWDSKKHYIKLENHYRQPEAYFKGNVQLSELLSSSFQQDLKKGLLTSYQSIMKTGTTAIPKSKADINAGTIPLMILKELEELYGFNTEELIKGKLKEIPEDVFSLDDRKARLRTIRDNLKKISQKGGSSYDIEELLQARLEA